MGLDVLQYRDQHSPFTRAGSKYLGDLFYYFRLFRHVRFLAVDILGLDNSLAVNYNIICMWC
jgi:hypothetical protein